MGIKGINKATMLQIRACAIIMADEKREFFARIAEENGETVEAMALRYTLGSLKAMIKRGQCATYAQAAEVMEDEQTGAMRVALPAMGSVAKDVARINAANRVTMASSAHARVRIGSSRLTARGLGKVYGSLYVEWIGKESDSSPDSILDANERQAREVRAESIIKAYINEYIEHVSKTAQKAIHEIVHSHYSVDSIMQSYGGEEGKLHNKIKYLHKGSPVADSVTAREWLELLRKYAA